MFLLCYHCKAQVNRPGSEAHLSWVTPKGYKGECRLQLVSALSSPEATWAEKGYFTLYLNSELQVALLGVPAENLMAVNTHNTHTLDFYLPAGNCRTVAPEGSVFSNIHCWRLTFAMKQALLQPLLVTEGVFCVSALCQFQL